MTELLIGLVALGLIAVLASYAQTRKRIRRAQGQRASLERPAWIGTPPRPTQSKRASSASGPGAERSGPRGRSHAHEASDESLVGERKEGER
jgi:hypothetical protein